MDFSLNRMPSAMRDIEWYWEHSVEEVDFSKININENEYSFTLNTDYFDMTAGKADQLSFIGRKYEFLDQPVSLKDFTLEIFGDIPQDTHIGMILNTVRKQHNEAAPYGLFATYKYLGNILYCAVTVCIAEKDWAKEMDVAVIEIGQDEGPYVLPVTIARESLEYFSFDDLMHLAYWLGNFWVGVQYEANCYPHEIRVVNQRGPIIPDEDEYKSRDQIVLIKRILAIDNDGNSIHYSDTGSGREFHVPSWGVRGHYRTLPNGRKIYINPYRKGKERDNPQVYQNKSYQFDGEKLDEDILKTK